MKTIITKRGYGISLESLNEEELEKLKTTLTVKPRIVPEYDFGDDTEFSVYRLSDTRIYIPIYYGIKHYGKPSTKERKSQNIESQNESQNIEFEFKGRLKDHQIDFCTKILEEITTKGSCIASSQTGSGKTCIALWIASKLKKRTLILVHKQFLLNQWIENIQKFLPKVSIGTIRQNEFDVDKDIVIGMIQTILSRDYPLRAFDSFKYTIFDESHHIACKTFSQVLFKCRSENNLALSATPTRADGLTKVLEWSLGKILINVISSDVESPTIRVVEAEYSSKIQAKFNFRGQLNNPDLINQLVLDKARNKQIIEEILKLCSEGRKILVLSGRRDHCVNLEQILKPHNLSSELYLGSMSNGDLQESNKAQVIFATYSMASEGYDNPSLDSLIMATGMGNITQSIGRILRKKNEHRPLVVDFTDPQFFSGQMRRRMQFYRKNKYPIEGIEDPIHVKEEPEECLFT